MTVSRNVLVIVLLSIAAIGSWYMARPQATETGEELPYDGAHRGYYLKHARILGTGEDGQLLYEIRAEHAEQQQDQSIEFSGVNILYSPDSRIPWTVNADAATLKEDHPTIALRGHVQIVNNGTSSENETEIRTQYLELDPDRFIAQTEQRVQIRFGTRSLTATGMLASLNDDRIELKSNVRGKIVP